MSLLRRLRARFRSPFDIGLKSSDTAVTIRCYFPQPDYVTRRFYNVRFLYVAKSLHFRTFYYSMLSFRRHAYLPYFTRFLLELPRGIRVSLFASASLSA